MAALTLGFFAVQLAAGGTFSQPRHGPNRATIVFMPKSENVRGYWIVQGFIATIGLAFLGAGLVFRARARRN